MNPKPILTVLLTLGLLLTGAFGDVPPAAAAPTATFNVNSTLDEFDADMFDGSCVSTPSGVCTLRAAIMESNAKPGADLIFLPSGSQFSVTYPLMLGLSSGGLSFADDVTLIGTGIIRPTIDGIGMVTVVAIGDPITVSISNVTITGGGMAGANLAGVGISIYHSGATVTLDNSIVSGNTASIAGGGIFNSGVLTVTDTRISGNNAPVGGGIYNAGTMTLNNSTVSGNTTSGDGGGIFNDGGTLTLNNSTIRGNAASGGGGGIYQDGGINTLTLNNGTVSGNDADGDGGGIYAKSGTTTLRNVTLTANEADADDDDQGEGGGIYRFGATVNIGNSILAGNFLKEQGIADTPDDCQGWLDSNGYNLIQTPAGCNITGAYLSGVNPNLGPLQSNGGPTWTHALLPGSPAIDAGSPSGCRAGAPFFILFTADQRGLPRHMDGNGDGSARCDIGAYEQQTAYFDIFLPLVIR